MIYTRLQKIILGVAAGACVLFVVASIVHGHYSDKVNASQRESDALKGQVQQLVQQINQSTVRERQLELNVEAANVALAENTKQLNATKIPVVKPLPSGPEDVKVELLAKGLVYEYGQTNTLTVDTSRMVLEAFNHIEAYDVAKKRIDALQSTLEASNEVVAKQAVLLKQKDERISLATNGMELNAKRADIAEGMIRDLRTANKANEVKWWVKVGGGVVAGYLVGRATHR